MADYLNVYDLNRQKSAVLQNAFEITETQELNKIYTLDFKMAAYMPQLFDKYGIRDMEMIQVTVSKMGQNNMFQSEPAPWIIYGRC